jgi:hypothetical protein
MSLVPCRNCPETFLDLLDTPDSYIGQANKVVVVNSSENGLVFQDISSLIGTKILMFDTLEQLKNFDASSLSINTLAFVRNIKTLFVLHNRANFLQSSTDPLDISFYDLSRNKIWTREDTISLFIDPTNGNDSYSGLLPSEAKMTISSVLNILNNTKNKKIILHLAQNLSYDFNGSNINTEEDVYIYLRTASELNGLRINDAKNVFIICDVNGRVDATFSYINAKEKVFVYNCNFVVGTIKAQELLLENGNLIIEDISNVGKTKVTINNGDLILTPNVITDSLTIYTDRLENERIFLEIFQPPFGSPTTLNKTNYNYYNNLISLEKEFVCVNNNKTYVLSDLSDEEVVLYRNKYPASNKFFLINLFWRREDADEPITNKFFKMVFDRKNLITYINLPIILWTDNKPYYLLGPGESVVFKFNTNGSLFKKLIIKGVFSNTITEDDILEISSNSYLINLNSQNIDYKDIFYYEESDFNSIVDYLVIKNKSRNLNFLIGDLVFEVGY